MSRTIIIGGGPAGMSAAVEIARAGGDAIIIDSNPRLGGRLARFLSRWSRQCLAQ
ncbi:MAG: FAD-dependent oxidoreductase [Actinobacteria bacterium]|nr:FAD-dependent oxidoreductase [Actinomycetota bacterium]